MIGKIGIVGIVLLLVLMAGCIGNASAASKRTVLLDTYGVDTSIDGATTTLFVEYLPDQNVTCFVTWHSWAMSCLPGRFGP